MKRRIRIGAASIMVAAGVIAAVAAPASAGPPTTTAAEQLCAQTKGSTEFIFVSSEEGSAYACLFPPFQDELLSESAVRPARNLCEQAYKGVFFIQLNDPGVGGPSRYGCFLP